MNDTKINYNILYCIISIYNIILFATSIQIQELNRHLFWSVLLSVKLRVSYYYSNVFEH